MLKIQKMLVGAMARLDEAMVMNLVTQGLKMGINPYVLLEEIRQGTDRVGELYSKGEYFLSDLIMASEIFKDVLALVNQDRVVTARKIYPTVIFGTVEDDIHDIGKNITTGIMQYNGFGICDLGVDVPARKFVEAVTLHNSRVVCLTGLITDAYDSMRDTVVCLEEAGLRPMTTVIIGGLVNESVRKYTGADYWATDCAKVAELCRNILVADKQIV
ncbi:MULTISPECIES: B12-binding domain-containing protein [Sporomusa]|jgi:methanogenic corrinoid protein MtbC1|uniref:cobalamin B12-binding domain-containing protein n=1 Tax=Sporomusa TaxID=2375 RepID=UPI00166A7168|nr:MULTISPECIES: cobalamin-dependent protein [Sporomusa]MCM0759845.1 cobalamin-dependent protein [Sporomusa sphaeroides DSM 2875]